MDFRRSILDHEAISVNSSMLGLILNDKLNFKEEITKKLCKAKKGIRVLSKMYHFIQRLSLLTKYKTFIRTHLDIIW